MYIDSDSDSESELDSTACDLDDLEETKDQELPFWVFVYQDNIYQFSELEQFLLEQYKAYKKFGEEWFIYVYLPTIMKVKE